MDPHEINRRGARKYFEDRGVYRNPYAIGSSEFNEFERGWMQSLKQDNGRLASESDRLTFGRREGLSKIPGEFPSRGRTSCLRDEIYRQARQNFGQRERASYIPHANLLALAKVRPPQNITPVVTSFADWVFGLDKDSTGDDLAKIRGKAGELVLVDGVLRDLTDLRRERWERIQAKKKLDMAYYANKRFPSGEWTLEFKGTGDADVKPLEISALRINQRPLLAKPDLVFRHSRTGDILIIELKTWNGQGRLPPFGWPNLKVQLWCYGMIDAWRGAPNVLLQGRVWRWLDRPTLEQPGGDAGLQHPGIVLQPWLSTDPRVHSECVELFAVFGGQYYAEP